MGRRSHSRADLQQQQHLRQRRYEARQRAARADPAPAATPEPVALPADSPPAHSPPADRSPSPDLDVEALADLFDLAELQEPSLTPPDRPPSPPTIPPAPTPTLDAPPGPEPDLRPADRPSPSPIAIPSPPAIPAAPIDIDIEMNHVLHQASRPTCDCDRTPGPLEGRTVGLYRMTRHWDRVWPRPEDDHPIPIPLRQTAPLPRDGRLGDYRHVDWKGLLGDDEANPSLDLAKSDLTAPDLQVDRRWDVDSFIGRPTSLAVHQFGFDLSYLPPFSRRTQQNPYVRFHGRPLHKLKNQRLGRGIIGGPYECHVFFPSLPIPKEGETHLTLEQQRVWVDDILLPALRARCPADILQHHPRCYLEVDAKAHAREEIHVSGSGQAVELQCVIPERYLQAFWSTVLENCRSEGLQGFRDPFLIVSGHNLKLWTKADGLEAARDRFLDHLGRCLHVDEEHLPARDSWIDLGVENTPGSYRGRHVTLLRKTGCNEHWVRRFRSPGRDSGKIEARRFTTTLMRDVGSSTVSLYPSHRWYRHGGMAYHKAYNLHKDVFATPIKEVQPFGLHQLEGLAYDQTLLNRWYELNRRGGQTQHLEKRQQLIGAYEKIKHRLLVAVRSPSLHDCTFGVREEYRVTLHRARRLQAIAEPPDDPSRHRPYYVVHTLDLHRYLAMDTNRWLLLLEALMCQTEQGPIGLSPIPAEEQMVHGVMAGAVIRILQCTLGSKQYDLQKSLWARDWPVKLQSDDPEQARVEVKLGLRLQDCLQRHGSARLSSDQVQWQGLPTFKPDIIHRLGLAKNGFGRQLKRGTNVQRELQRENAYFQLYDRWLKEAPVDTTHIDGERGQLWMLQLAAELVVRCYTEEIFQILQQRAASSGSAGDIVRERLEPEEAQGLAGLTYSLVEELMHLPPHIVLVKNVGRRNPTILSSYLTTTWGDRIAGLFSLDDAVIEGQKLRGWEHAPFRVLIRRFTYLIRNAKGLDAVTIFQGQLVAIGCEKLWILPQYDLDKLSVMQKVSKHHTGETREMLKNRTELQRTNWVMPQLPVSYHRVLSRLEDAWENGQSPSATDMDDRDEISEVLNDPGQLSVLSETDQQTRYHGLVKDPERFGLNLRLDRATKFLRALRDLHP